MPAPAAALALGLALLSAPAQADPPPPEPQATGAPAAAPAAAAQEPAPSASPVPSGLPRRAPEPRTMQAFWPVFAALALGWVAIMGYLLTLGRRSGRIARALRERDAAR